jgi:hypothetical protein
VRAQRLVPATVAVLEVDLDKAAIGEGLDPELAEVLRCTPLARFVALELSSVGCSLC